MLYVGRTSITNDLGILRVCNHARVPKRCKNGEDIVFGHFDSEKVLTDFDIVILYTTECVPICSTRCLCTSGSRP